MPSQHLNLEPVTPLKLVHTGGVVVVRFVTDNPGVWAVHCHLDQHLEDGQIMILDEGGYRQSTFPADYPSCDYKGL